MVQHGHVTLSVVRQCDLLGVSRSGQYYTAKGEPTMNQFLMQEIDLAFTEWPFLGAPDAELFAIAGLRGQRPATTAVASRTALHACTIPGGKICRDEKVATRRLTGKSPSSFETRLCASYDFVVGARSGNNEATAAWVVLKIFKQHTKK